MAEDFYDIAIKSGEADFSFLENERKFSGFSAFDFLHGYCDVFSYVLQERIGGRIEAVVLDGWFVHAYVVIEKEIDGATVPVFCDVRGMTSDYIDFMREFECELAMDFSSTRVSYPIEETRVMSLKEIKEILSEYKGELDDGVSLLDQLVSSANELVDFYGFWDDCNIIRLVHEQNRTSLRQRIRDHEIFQAVDEYPPLIE